ncbi:ABC transporter ATP-binding protein [Kitasatospora sp. NPDC028055]|uniref:ABC transporter ATP-binding protein n=1 Tax=Kitasatospora sp. NPDC028055 TaxID=3155653 RepID=UPI0033DBC4C3
MLLRLLRTRVRLHLRPVGLLLLLQLVQTAAAVALPRLNAAIVDQGVASGGTGAILRSGGAMLGLSAVQVACTGGVLLIGSRVAAAIAHDLRASVFRHVRSLGPREVARFGAASLVSRTVGDVQQVQALVLLVLVVTVAAPLTLVCGVVLAYGQDPALTALLVLVVPALGVPTAFAVRRMRPLLRGGRTALDEAARVLREQIGGQRVVRSFCREEDEARRFAVHNGELLSLSLRTGRLMALMSPLSGLVLNCAGVAVLWIGGHRITGGGLSAGALIAFLGYLSQVLSAVALTAYLFVALPRAEVSAERILEVLDTAASVPQPRKPVRAPLRGGRLEIRDAGFRHPDAEDPVLTGVGLTAAPGETVGVVGPTGSGKSTLLNLVLRLHDTTTGTVRIDGVDIRDLAPAALTGTVSVVPQRPTLFSGTIADNLRLGRPGATEDELWRALETAQARAFVEDLDGALLAPVRQGGANLSGGQRQRLAIARALVADPAVLLLDDPASALDQATAAALLAALARANTARTVLLTGRRADAVRDADRIVVLEAGRVVGTGTHAQLLAGNATYRALARSRPSVDGDAPPPDAADDDAAPVGGRA